MSDDRCPICRRPLLDDVAKQPRPFCSRRCKMADLGNWLEGRYVIAQGTDEAEMDGLDLDDADLATLLSDNEDERDR